MKRRTARPRGLIGPIRPIRPISTRLPPRSAPGIVVFGGSFDPPHRWHIAAARAARTHLFGPRGWIVFIPAARSPLKQEGPVAPDAHRVAMLRLAAARLPRSATWTGELERTGPSYTIDTLRQLRRRYPRTPLRLLIGADQAAAFHRWREFREVIRLAEPAVVLRPPIRTRAALRRALRRAGVWTDEEVESWSARVVPLRTRAVASTDLRQALSRMKGGRASVGLRTAIPSTVLAYIARHGLYRAERGTRRNPRGHPSIIASI